MIRELFHIFHDSLNSFRGQREDENVLRLLRHHPFIIIIKLIFFAVAGILPLIAGAVFWQNISSYGLSDMFAFLMVIWWLALWLGIFHALTIYTLDTVVITNKRLIDNDQIGMFNRRASELHVDMIQDVSSHTNGFIETFLDFGDVTVQTAAAEKQFVFHKIPRPEKVKDAIMELTRPRI